MEKLLSTTRRFRKATLRDVAEQVGVSQTTVSKFVGGREDICSAETATRIREAVEMLNYVPGRATRGLRDRATHTVGVCLSSPFDLLPGELPWFFEQLWRGISREADERDYTLLHYPSSVREGNKCDPFLDGRVDGLIFQANRHDLRPAMLGRAGMPVVLLSRSRDVPSGCGAAFADEEATADLAMSHLWELGHRRIAHLAGPSELVGPPEVGERNRDHDVAIRRRDAYISWLTARGTFDPALLAIVGAWNGELREPFIEETLRAWRALAAPPTAIFCANDNLAWAVLRVARRLKWRVPNQLSVVGVDNWPPSVEVEPPLSSVEVPLETVGREAARALFRQMNDPDHNDKNSRIQVPVTRLVLRNSTAPPPT